MSNEDQRPGELILLGTVRTFSGARVDVTIDSDGDMTLYRHDGASREWIFRPADREKLTELLQRAAMPGQVPPVARPCCRHCKHPAPEAHPDPCPWCEPATEADDEPSWARGRLAIPVCEIPRDCPNGPEPHAFKPPGSSLDPCCQQPSATP